MVAKPQFEKDPAMAAAPDADTVRLESAEAAAECTHARFLLSLLAMQWCGMAFAMLAMLGTGVGPTDPRLALQLAVIGACSSGLPWVFGWDRRTRFLQGYAIATGQVCWSLALVAVGGLQWATCLHLAGSVLLTMLLGEVRFLLLACLLAIVGLFVLDAATPDASLDMEQNAGWMAAVCFVAVQRQIQSQRTRAERSQLETDLRTQAEQAEYEGRKEKRAREAVTLCLHSLLESQDGPHCLVERDGHIALSNGRWKELDLGQGDFYALCRMKDSLWGQTPELSRFADDLLSGRRTEATCEIEFHGKAWRVRMASAQEGRTSDAFWLSAINVTDERRTKSLADQRARQLVHLIGAMNASCQAIALLDNSGEIIWVNDALEDLTGFSESHLEGEQLHYYLAAPGVESDALAAIDDCIKLQVGCDVECRCQSSDMTSYPGLFRIRPIHHDDQVAGFSVVHEDRRSELEAMQQREDLQRRLEYTAAQFSAVSTTGQTLEAVLDSLGKMEVTAGLVLNRVRSRSCERLERVNSMLDQHADSLEDFLKNDERGQRIPEFLQATSVKLAKENISLQSELRDLLALMENVRKTVESGREILRLNPQAPMDLNAVVRDAILAFRSTNLEPKLELDDSLPPFYADRHKTLQIALNLLSNALQATGGGPTRIKTFRRNNVAVLEVTDDGCGIDPQDLSHVFRRGFTTWEEGQGYGLYCSREAAEEMGGELRVQSDGLSRGATFTCELPLHSADWEPEDVSASLLA